MTESKNAVCLVCSWLYDVAEGCPEQGVAPQTPWADVPADWTCPHCHASKQQFELIDY